MIIVPATLTLGPGDPRLNVMLDALDVHIAQERVSLDESETVDTDVIVTDRRRHAVGLAGFLRKIEG